MMRFTKTVALLLCLCLLFSMVSCTAQNNDENIKYVDLIDKAIELSGIENSLQHMPSKTYGTGAFNDYMYLHSNPLMTCSYSMEITALSKQIEANAKGLDEFCREVIKSYGFKRDCDSLTDSSDDIKEAIRALYKLSSNEEGLDEALSSVEKLNPKFSKALARFIWASAYACEKNMNATNGVTDATFDRVADYFYCDVATSDPSSLEFVKKNCPSSRERALLDSGIILIEASCELIASFSSVSSLTVDGNALSIPTPFGDIMIGSSENDVYNSPETLLLIDPKGNDTYNGKVAASRSPDEPISIVIDVCGDDSYVATDKDGATQGAGIFGTGLLFDLGGNDTYKAYRIAQGAALIGVGVLYDGGGNDIYKSNLTTQGAAYFGFALLADASGNDAYSAMGVAQASAGTRAMAFLVDKTGNDNYYVAPYEVEGFEFLDYGQFPDVNGNWSQGCAMGQRNIDISGGIAGLIDHDGDDSYTGGIWVQGVGYWSGVGFLADMSGHDNHKSLYYSQASVAHYGVGILINVGGNDRHSLEEGITDGGEGASLGFVWDRGVAMFVNDGGKDIYIAERTSCGVSQSEYDEKGYNLQDQSYAFFIDTEGDDTYSKVDLKAHGFGRGGFFIDAGGSDKYISNVVSEDTCKRSAVNYGGVIIDYNATENERATLKIWEAAKAKYFLQ